MDALPTGSPALEFLRVIRKETERAAELCRQMLAYAGRGGPIVEATDLNSTLRETADLLQVSVGKRIQVHFDLAPPTARGHRGFGPVPADHHEPAPQRRGRHRRTCRPHRDPHRAGNGL